MRRALRIGGAAAVAAMITGCPLPFDYNGKGAANLQTPDPSSPNVTAAVTVSYSEQGGTTGTIADGGSYTSGKTITVTLSTATNNSVIYYSDDGMALTSLVSAKKFDASSGSITITRSTGVQTLDIHAIAVGPSMLPSLPVHVSISVSPYPILTVTVNNAAIPESNGTATFTITSSSPAPSPMAVSLQTGGTYAPAEVTGLAASGTTFTATIPKSATSVTLPINAHPDTNLANETVTLTVLTDTGTPPAYTVGSPAAAQVTIQDNQLVTLTLTSDRTLMTNVQLATFTVTSSAPVPANITVPISSSGYTPGQVFIPSTVALPAGSSTATFTVTALAALGFPTQSALVALGSGTGWVVGSPGSQTLAITDSGNPDQWNFANGLSGGPGAPTWVINGTVPTVGGALDFPGNYPNDTAQLSVGGVINQNLFTLGIGFNLADYSTSPWGRPLIVGGISTRWLIIRADPSGHLLVDLNNHATIIDTGFTVTTGVNHTVLMSIDLSTLSLVVYYDGVRFSTSLPGSFAWNNGGSDQTLDSADYSTGSTFAGLWYWVSLSNTVLP